MMNANESSYKNQLVKSNPQENDEIDVVINYIPRTDKEVIKNVKADYFDNGDLNLTKLVTKLKKMDIPVKNSTVFYYSTSADMFIYCGKEPLQEDTAVPGHEISQTQSRRQLSIRLRNSDIDNIKSEIEVEENLNNEHARDGDDGEKRKSRRHKERKIGDVLDLVLKWRKLYAGVKDPRSGQITKYTLEEAAKKIGVAKKSLDDYLLQIRTAKRFGFNFQENAHERIGILRSFVKKQRGSGKKIPNEADTLGDDFDN